MRYAILIVVLAVLLASYTTAQTPQSNGENLIEAAKEGQTNEVHALLRAGVDVNTQTIDGFTAMIVAAQYGHVEIVDLCINAGADTDMRMAKGFTALMVAARFGHLPIALSLLDAGADIHLQTNNGITALSMASFFGHSDILELLIESGAKVNQKNKWGSSSLILAARSGHIRVVRHLIQAGAEIDTTDNENLSALMWASLQGHKAVVHLMLEHGAAGMYFEGGDGSSIENAIIIKGAPNAFAGVAAESLWFGKKHHQWRKVMQALYKKNDKRYDVITYSTPEGTQSLFFDITDFWGKGFEDLLDNISKEKDTKE